ncbi:hypothetical protein ACFWCA_50230 [Streptomyces phaeochromogenes]
MIHAADDREWRNCDVVDSEGHKAGGLEALHVLTAHGHDDWLLGIAL